MQPKFIKSHLMIDRYHLLSVWADYTQPTGRSVLTNQQPAGAKEMTDRCHDRRRKGLGLVLTGANMREVDRLDLFSSVSYEEQLEVRRRGHISQMFLKSLQHVDVMLMQQHH